MILQYSLCIMRALNGKADTKQTRSYQTNREKQSHPIRLQNTCSKNTYPFAMSHGIEYSFSSFSCFRVTQVFILCFHAVLQFHFLKLSQQIYHVRITWRILKFTQDAAIWPRLYETFISLVPCCSSEPCVWKHEIFALRFIEG